MRRDPGAAPLDDPFFQAGRRVGKYELVRRLAVGGMAEVYLARAKGIEGFEKLVVLKRVLPQYADRPEAIGMFLDEARLAAALDHPNIVQVHDIGEENGHYFYAMEYVHGANLADVLEAERARGRRVPLGHAVAIIQAAAAGLHHAHERRSPEGLPLAIVHRDVTPSNVLLTREGVVKIADFGIAKASVSQRAPTRPGEVKGKVSYMSPEQYRGQEVDRRTDVFALGVLLYELGTGETPFPEAPASEMWQRLVAEDVPPPSSRVPGFPAALEAITLKALRRNRAQRYATAQELQVDLEQFARGEGPAASAVELARYLESLFEDRWRQTPAAEGPAPGRGPGGTLVKPEGEAAMRPRALRAWRRTAVAAGVVVAAAAIAGTVLYAWRGRDRQPRAPAAAPADPARASEATATSALAAAAAPGCLAGVAVGGEHTCVWNRGGTAACWGENRYGQLGDGRNGKTGSAGESSARTIPVLVLEAGNRPLTGVESLAAGRDFTCARKLDNTVWCWGRNHRGQLGNGVASEQAAEARATPVHAGDSPEPLRGAVVVAAGAEHACVRREDGHVWCWGSHRVGQLGDGSAARPSRPHPQPIPIDEDGPMFARLYTGAAHVCATKPDGTAWCWGQNGARELGTRAQAQFVPKPAVVRLRDGGVMGDVVDLGLGRALRAHSCAVRKDGALWCWGENGFGQLGSGVYEDAAHPLAVALEGAADVEAGLGHTCVLTSDHSVWCFGDNTYGQLGAGIDAPNAPRPVRVLTARGGPPLARIVALSVGDFSTCALAAGGSVWCWGRNESGQLGTGDNTNRTTATHIQADCL